MFHNRMKDLYSMNKLNQITQLFHIFHLIKITQKTDQYFCKSYLHYILNILTRQSTFAMTTTIAMIQINKNIFK